MQKYRKTAGTPRKKSVKPGSRPPQNPRVDYPEARAWLDSLITRGIKLGLERPRAHAARLGDPQKKIPAVVIGGTNGKGSTLAFLASLALANQTKIGQQTSPHLRSPRERIKVDDREISPAAFAAALAAVRETADAADPPTYFEAITLASFVHFEKAGVGLALHEVGLGGRLDCANLVDPVLSIVTSIGHDHMEFLGPTLTRIAREKAGIFRPGLPALTGARDPEALAALRAAADEIGAPLEILDEIASWREDDDGAIRFRVAGEDFPPLRLALNGEHQKRNAALALRAAQRLRARGLAGPAGHAESAFALARWPGRLQPFFNGKLWLDGAHNGESAAALAEFVRGLPAPRRLLFGVMRDKAIAELAGALFPVFDEVWLVKTRYARGAAPDEIRAALPESLAGRVAREFPDPDGALAASGVRPGGFTPPDRLTVIAGSLFLVGEALEFLQGKLA